MTDPHSQEDSIPFYPDHVRTEFRVVLGVMVIFAVIAVLALVNPIGLGDPADPMNTPAHVKPEWYFLALYQVLKYIPAQILGVEGKVFGAVIPVLLVGLVAIWPFLDRKPDQSRTIYRRRFIFVAVGVIILIAMTIWGEVG